MKTEIIQITKTGEVEFISNNGKDCPLDLPLGNGSRRRLSHIRPEVFWKKIAFILFRKIFGDDGRIAGWTRTWTGPWRATILSTGQTEVFENRQAAVDWEYEIITEPRFDL